MEFLFLKIATWLFIVYRIFTKSLASLFLTVTEDYTNSIHFENKMHDIGHWYEMNVAFSFCQLFSLVPAHNEEAVIGRTFICLRHWEDLPILVN